MADADFYSKFEFLLRAGIKGLALGLALTVSFYLAFFRVIFYPVYLYSIVAPVSLKRNPYLRDAVIWLPVPGLRKKLAVAVRADLTEGGKFIEFLLEYRPLQRGLAQHLIHAVTAEACMRDKNYRLILAFDEYETLHPYLSADPQAGGRLLGALRSFSQQQNRVVFLFTGAALFSELRAPNWSQYFVQAVRFPVDYLARSEALRLITEPVDLRYPPEVPARLFELTQGHPALLQLICRELVDIANRDLKKQMGMADLDEALRKVMNRETLAIEVFWGEFCVAPETRQTVWQILRGEPPTHKPSLARLKEHGYIVADGETWKLRVPLFEQWVREFG